MSSPLPLRRIGDAKVSAIGYGAMGLSGYYGDTVGSDEERLKVSISLNIDELTLIFCDLDARRCL
jgi:hypothetical protein